MMRDLIQPHKVACRCAKCRQEKLPAFAVEPFAGFGAATTETEWAGELEAEMGRRRFTPQRRMQSRVRPTPRPRRRSPRRRPGRRRWGPSVFAAEPTVIDAPPSASQGSEHVRWVQHTLNQVMNLNLPVDGVMNVETRSAIRSFQEKQGLPVDGIVGPATEQALRGAEAGKAPEPDEDPPTAEFDFEWKAEVNRSSPEYARWVQQALNQIMGLRLAVDGVVGPLTRSAIRSFQQKYGLLVDGIVGPQTESALVAAGAGNPPGIVSAPYLPPSAPSQQGSTFDPSCNGAQQKILSLVLKRTKQMVDRALVRMQILSMDQSGGSDKNYIRWFGAFDKSRAHHVLRTYQLIARALEKEIEFACDCDKQIYARVFPGLKLKIHLCAGFWGAPFSGLDSKPGVILHELAHEVLRGGDFRYSIPKAERLAVKFPWLAVRNADNYEYFAESL